MTTKDKQPTTLFFHPDLIKLARAQAVVEDRTLTDLIEKALIHYLPKEIVIIKPEI